MARILVCDDDRDIVSALCIYLGAEGHETVRAYCGKEALAALNDTPVQLVLLDIMMPGMDGIETLGKIRACSNVPVIMLTAKSEDADKVLGLNIGADDYVTKPFAPLELMARVRSQLRRYTRLGSALSEEVLRVGGVELCDPQKRVTKDGEEIYYILNSSPQANQVTLSGEGTLQIIDNRTGDIVEAKDVYHLEMPPYSSIIVVRS